MMAATLLCGLAYAEARCRCIGIGGWQVISWALVLALPVTATVSPVGLYSVNVAFSDEHDRGVYPWPFLEKLGAKPTRAVSA